MFRGHWQSARAVQQDHDARRGTAASRGYDSKWRLARAGYFRSHPFCVCCQVHGRVEPAQVLDHIEPHKGDKVKFWDRENWQGLCQWCDKNIKRAVENRWLRGDGSIEVLKLNYRIDGWVHPSAR